MPRKKASRHDAAATEAEVLDALLIGAGFSGICLAIRLLEAGIRNFRVFEKAEEVGGTWHFNRYPGAACDVLSHFYCFSFEPNPDWTRRYSPWAEIREYLEHCADKYALRPHLRLGREVTQVRFVDHSGLWEISCADGRRVLARHVIDGSGGLHVPWIPEIEGADSFGGDRWHSSRWPAKADMQGRKVAVIGSAASSIQIVPELAREAAGVTVFQRTANYVIPRKDRAYRRWEKWAFRHLPGFARLYRAALFARYDRLAHPIVGTGRDNLQRRYAMWLFRRHLSRQIRNPELRAELTPDFPIGCKRILLSDDFYPALARPNVKLVTSGIRRIEASGLRSGDGRLHKADVLIYATGFDTQGDHPAERVTGPGGHTLAEAWAAAPVAYQGCMVAGFPNYYLVTGPNTGTGSTSVVFLIEQMANFILDCIERAGRERLISPTPQAMEAYDRDIQGALAGTVWATSCRSWYKRDDGRITALYPWNARTFRRHHRRAVPEHFELRLRPPA